MIVLSPGHSCVWSMLATKECCCFLIDVARWEGPGRHFICFSDSRPILCLSRPCGLPVNALMLDWFNRVLHARDLVGNRASSMIALNQSICKPAPVTLSKAEEHTVCRDLEQWHGLVLRMQYGCCLPFWKSRESAKRDLRPYLENFSS